MKIWILGILAIVLLAAGALAFWAWTENRPVEGTPEHIFRIAPGQGLSTIADRLAQDQLIRNPLLFRLLFQASQGERAIPSGTFRVPGGLTALAAVEFFRDAQPLQVRVTVPEGWTSTKIAKLLEEKQVVKAADFLSVVRNPSLLGSEGRGLATLEGRLFPDTYLFSLEMSAQDVVQTFVQNFETRTAPWHRGFTPEEWENKIVLASIVEREYRVSEEAPVIASVFMNRLDRGIPLGSCASIEFILTEIQGRPHPKRIFLVHTQIPSPYNTYLHKGLPPAPISNPGLTALRAVFEPVETPYLYFVVADPGKGTHTFSSNFARHQQAREAYLNSFVTKG